MSERDASRRLGGLVQIDDAYLGGERNGGKAGRGSENKRPFVIGVLTTEAGHPQRRDRSGAGLYQSGADPVGATPAAAGKRRVPRWPGRVPRGGGFWDMRTP
jgi:hypothetical protein